MKCTLHGFRMKYFMLSECPSVQACPSEKNDLVQVGFEHGHLKKRY